MPCLQCGHCGKCGRYAGYKMELVCSICDSSVVPGAIECVACGASAKLAQQTNLNEIVGGESLEGGVGRDEMREQ